MSEPRVTVTVGRGGKQGERHVSMSSIEMYADQANGGRNPRKRSIRDRLGGGNVVQLAIGRQAKIKRVWKDDDGKWKHDLYEDMEEPGMQQITRPNLRLVRQRKGGLSLGVTDLREKLSGSSSQPPAASRAQGGVELQRQLTSFVRNSSSGAQAASHQGSKQTVTGLLQSLGLAKYSLIFQAEEVDMAALRHMSDSDLKELGVPMGPRKKILLALGHSKVSALS
ncbi:unnamed protein product [Sphagnum jensenii]|uniref:SAM domain-containing protein n=1 Tax=Sphagnum jensenii TaxID=128206 RepID=A0ABP0WSU3_9BRYO